jgi:hypothetical protein
MSTLSLHTQAQRPDAAKPKADPRKVVGGISDDRAKTDALGRTADCSEQLDRAGQEKNRKNSVDFSRLQKAPPASRCSPRPAAPKLIVTHP